MLILSNANLAISVQSPKGDFTISLSEARAFLTALTYAVEDAEHRDLTGRPAHPTGTAVVDLIQRLETATGSPQMEGVLDEYLRLPLFEEMPADQRAKLAATLHAIVDRNLPRSNRFEDLTRFDQRMALLPIWNNDLGHTVIGVYPNGTRWGIVLVSPAGTECRTAFDRHTTRSVEQFIETLN